MEKKQNTQPNRNQIDHIEFLPKPVDGCYYRLRNHDSTH